MPEYEIINLEDTELDSKDTGCEQFWGCIER